MRLLLIEDNPSIRENTADWLRSRGHTVVTAPCAFAAKNVLSHEAPFDALILDTQLPCGQGDFIKHWLLEGGAGDMPVVVWTAMRDTEINGFRVLYKPCSNEELEQAVVEECAKRRAGAAP